MTCQLYGIGNALVDSEYLVSEAVLDQSGFTKGTMTLVDADERSSLITLLEDTAGISLSQLAGGGSAANTIVTAALLGTETFYSCKVASDRTGDFFVDDLIGLGIQTSMSGQRPDGVTGECISMITPDGERTLVTHLGISGSMSSSEIDAKALSAAQFLYIEGYLVSSEAAFEAVLEAQRIAVDNQVAVIHDAAEQVQKETGQKIKYLVGTMIEIPRGALTADAIAETAEFFSFGTNDLTQTTLGMSRDDMGSFLNKYTEEGIFKANPFASIDIAGVGQLMKIAVQKGRESRPKIKLGICGEHGGDPHSVHFCHELGLDYVSCSPYRVPVARLAAAQAAVQ